MQERARELRLKLVSVLPLMNELQRRILVAAEARAYGRGGVQTLAQITGMSRQTIYRGLQDLLAKQKKPSGRIRRPGGGRKKLRDQYPGLVETLERLIEPTVRGDPQSLLRWTCKSVRSQRRLRSRWHACAGQNRCSGTCGRGRNVCMEACPCSRAFTTAHTAVPCMATRLTT